MITLSFGYRLPQAGDRGVNPLFNGLEFNITRLNGHNHDGSNSTLLTAQSITAVSASIVSGSWVLFGDGLYRQLVTVVAGFDFDKVQIGFRLSTTNEFVYPKIERVSATQYYIYVNDNTINLTAVYGG